VGGREVRSSIKKGEVVLNKMFNLRKIVSSIISNIVHRHASLDRPAFIPAPARGIRTKLVE
jgi:hypothetical protein